VKAECYAYEKPRFHPRRVCARSERRSVDVLLDRLFSSPLDHAPDARTLEINIRQDRRSNHDRQQQQQQQRQQQ